ncbi:hypothetical protein EGW08_009850 [Elysia chlorotica]|uniref:Dermatopontin n=1 Tax=Elysia chlorotica TaxID=188477 RepID=A0A3S1HME7_ELYCH|nr:hypothetical protein EGW08_009843 [Elysia chlorotica]RUS82398.1 hypothetical protein EGW08_009850 [Elysia chlorotica]
MCARYCSQAALLALLLGLALGQSYENDWDQPLDFSCPEGQLISYVNSYHSNYYEDRRWRFYCRNANYGAVTSCEWTSDYVNDWDGALSYMCPENMALAGVASVHSNYYEDRRLKFKCCGHAGYKMDSCILTGELHAPDKELKYFVPDGSVLGGWVSEHFDVSEDRIHRMIVCKFNK